MRQETGKPKVLMFDIETTNLSADYGYVICASWKYLGDNKIYTAKITDSPTFKKDPTNDKYVIQGIAEAIKNSDVIVGWYSSKFDYPMIQSRLLYHNLDPLPPVPHVDGWRIAKYKMKLSSNRLANVAAFLGLEQKTPLSGPIWIKAMAGHAPSIKYVVKHCEQDVVVLEQAYNKIKPLSTSHPNVALVNNKSMCCPICGVAGKIQKRGYTISRTTKKSRYQCQACGGWSSGKSIKTDIEIR